MFGFFHHGLGPLANFQASYRAYPVSFIDKLDAEKGDKVFLPPSALDQLSSMNLEYPMLFNVTGRQSGRETHCGVLEFIADEGMMYMPYWMMQNMALSEGDVVKVRNQALPKGTYVKLQPHTTDFINISNPKAVLETTLRGYTCLTVGDAICVYYNNKKYYIDVTEAKPANAISVVDTDCEAELADSIFVADIDCEVDFAQPLDYVEPAPQPRAAAQPASEAAGPSTSAAEPAEPEEPKFLAFAGSGRRLDGKAPKLEAKPVAVPLNQYQGGWRTAAESLVATGGGPQPEQAANGAGPSADGKKAGKVVFGGGNRLAAKKDKPKELPKPKDETKDEGSKFAAFGGKPNKLR